ncbi:multiple epidermal growth factor-like domains protein 10 isoform X1 [Saccostrea cucullata]|uniref:multiple epidermal growth factor-like domains protein 10 isoform X1 n=1 Tax=Saccostrea cuccullata TaxID=36930 RepID=UPI002ED33E87
MDSRIVLFRLLTKYLTIGIFATAYDNVALRKLTGQQCPYTDRPLNAIAMAEKAVDGLYSNRSVFGGQCTISANSEIKATLWVDLGVVSSIHHITIYYRTENNPWDETNNYTSRFLGFSVYISNTTNKDEGILCFKDTKYTRATIPDIVTKECVTHGRYVIYYNERLSRANNPHGYSEWAFSELCELEVYGCSTPGVYGKNCDVPCPQNCQERHCNIVNGTCLGCVTGYKGPRCEEQCDNYKYGFECSLTCGNCSNGEQCNHVNGSCTNGCGVGAQGYLCNETCPVGRYGNNCLDICSINCGVPLCYICGRCNRVTGECQRGCQPGWKDMRCDKKCDENKFGLNCAQSCGVCMGKEQCHHINGTCLTGCDRGYQGIKCTQECPDGRYGYNCNETCNINCGVPGRCNRVTGECQGGCQEGWKDMRCDQKCGDEKFGLNCAQSCGICLDKEQCHHINGTCLNGCDKGYQGTNCNEECPWGFHGYSCNKTCSNDCFNRSCNAVTGACPVEATSDLLETNTFLIIGGTTAIIVVSLAAAILCFIFRRKNTSGTAKYQNNSKKKAEKLSLENTTPNKDIYDEIGEKGTYQELEPRTEVSDDGRYEKLGVSDTGENHELGPGMEIHDKSKDNTEYQELGQINEHFYYDKLQ